MKTRSAVLSIFIAVTAAIGLFLYSNGKRARDDQAVYDAVGLLKVSQWHYAEQDSKKTGMWRYAKDLASLHRAGMIPREIAEAESTLITPMVPRPVPYHGYLFLVMEVGSPLSGHGRLRPEDRANQPEELGFGICAWPADESTGDVYLCGPSGVYRKRGGPSGPLRVWPFKDEYQANWGICD